jgi:copper homeostasis protein
MSIVSTPDQAARLAVAVARAADVSGAQEGGADLLHLADPDGRSPAPVTVSQVCRETDVPVRVLLRLSEGYSTTGGELVRLAGLAESYLAAGAEGLLFGFLDADLRIDRAVCVELAERLHGAAWTFDRAFDSALMTGRAWRDVATLPGCDTVVSAGSPRGIEAGAADLVARASADPVVARLLVAGGRMTAEQVPWLARAGVRRFRVGSSTRPGRSVKAYVDAGLVRSWRLLVDDAVERANRQHDETSPHDQTPGPAANR